MIYIDNSNFLGANVQTIKKHTITSAVTGKEVHMEINNEESSCMFMSCA
jgi:hypothetical protein